MHLSKNYEGFLVGTSKVLFPRMETDFVRIKSFVGLSKPISEITSPWNFRLFIRLSRLQVAEAARCEEKMTDCEVPHALEQVGLKKSPGFDGLSY